MSILDNNSPQINHAENEAKRLIDMTRQTYFMMVNSFNSGAQVFWQNGSGTSPSEIAAALGSNAKEVFELHYKLGQLIASVQPEAISTGVSLIGNFTMNEDGTVTVNSPTSEE